MFDTYEPTNVVCTECKKAMYHIYPDSKHRCVYCGHVKTQERPSAPVPTTRKRAA